VIGDHLLSPSQVNRSFDEGDLAQETDEECMRCQPGAVGAVYVTSYSEGQKVEVRKDWNRVPSLVSRAKIGVTPNDVATLRRKVFAAFREALQTCRGKEP
jgi:hypothetical protein